MNARTIGYWVTTGLFSFALLGSGAMNLSGAPEVAASLAHLGFPAYLATILGTWKVLGVLALLAPGLPRLKEWAYAGYTFSLTGAAASHAFAGDPAPNVVTPLVLLAIGLASWALRPEGRRLGTVIPSAAPSVRSVAA